ncbi:Oligouridylate-binding family protein [Rhynchospora pubera]|uniref:Oligouridylate-binding family protein n=1 Tax=Rhynchospora pubera TaxID=906938 RepID=A0AAV8HAA9_9POAL|nr:Oligouridylate-binding family protein [Rhynchospora pubera]
MQQQQRLKQQQNAALMQQAMLLQQQQQSLYPHHPGLLAAPQIEPILSGNLPPGFDPSTCRSVYVGNVHLQVTEALLQEVFQSVGPVEGCKLIRKEKSSFGFVDYYDRRSAALAIVTLNGRQLFGQPIKVNWAYASGQREDTSGHFNIFVGDLSPEVTDATLFACFSVYTSCSDARVMWDQKTGRSRGFGFVSFRSQQDAQSAINDLNGKWLGSRQIRCNWATKGANTGDEKQSSDSKSVVELTAGTSGMYILFGVYVNPLFSPVKTLLWPSVLSLTLIFVDLTFTEGTQEATNEEAPENNPQYTTVYVGNLAHEVTQVDLHRLFHSLNAGVIEDVRTQRDKGFGFVRYSTHTEAALAIQMGNGQILCGKPIKCSWGSKPTPLGTASTPLPPPGPAPFPAGLSATDLLAYERSLAISKMAASNQALMGQHALKQAAMGMGAGASQAIYDGGFQNVTAAQQLMYY